MASVLHDMRLASRAWMRSPTFTLTAIASVGLGIGANVAIFTLVDQVLLRALPIRNPREMVQVTSEGSRPGSNWGDDTELSYPTYAALRDQNKVFSGMFARFGYAFQVGGSVQPERVVGELVSGTYFPVLGVRPAAGRLLSEDDDRTPGGHPVAVLSHAFWTSRFGADPGAVGRSMAINGRPYTIVGVAQAGFEGIELGRPTQVFVPMMMKAQTTPGWSALDERLNRWVRVFGRLRPGLTSEQARAGLEPLFRSQLQLDLDDRGLAEAPASVRQRYVQNALVLLPAAQGRSSFRRALTAPLWLLMGTAAGVLLIACANVANLLLARGAARGREMAVRLALGATRRRLVQQLLAESLMLSLAGALAGLMLAAVGAPLVLRFFVNPDTPQPVSTSPDLRIFAFALTVSTLTGILFGLAPALQSTRPDVAPTLKDYATGVLGGGSARLRKALVASQVAVSLLLLIGAGLFLRTLDNLLAVDIGFDARTLVSFTVDPSLNGYTPATSKQFAKALLERLSAAPGVAAAGLASQRLLDGSQRTTDITVAGYRPASDEEMEQNWNSVGPGYFRAMGIPVLRGREFDARDESLVADGPAGGAPFRVVIVNERFAKRYFGAEDPIGRRMGFGSNPSRPTPIEIVGVVRDSKYTGVRDEAQRQLFFPYLEEPNPRNFTVYVRTSRPPETAFATVREVVRQLDPNLPVAGTRTVEQQVDLSLRRERLVATMSAVFGGLATLLAVVGLYGVMAYTVACRTREIGIRMALGAGTADIGWMVLREALALTAAGMAIALPAAWWLSGLVASQLYGVTASDPLTVATAVALLGAVSLLAGLLPSRRAARLEPTVALRYE
ncbi:MAG: multidrug ABC transporter substrate-binding protein [Acidobacteria bacterium]|nr:MAG: multidrug ABC transporter substrate-binding protein [Acidobacteriota bacterium]